MYDAGDKSKLLRNIVLTRHHPYIDRGVTF